MSYLRKFEAYSVGWNAKIFNLPLLEPGGTSR